MQHRAIWGFLSAPTPCYILRYPADRRRVGGYADAIVSDFLAITCVKIRVNYSRQLSVMLQFIFERCEFLNDTLSLLALFFVGYITNSAVEVVNSTSL